MPISRPSPYRRHVLGALSVGVIGLAMLAARQQGWLQSVSEHGRDLAAGPHSRFTRTDDDVPDPIDFEELQLPPDATATDSELDERAADAEPQRNPRSRKKTVRPSQWTGVGPPRLELEDGFDVTSPDDADSRIATVGFDDDAHLVDRSKIQKLIDDGNYVDAQHELSRWYWHRPAEREKLLPQLNKMAQALYFSAQPHYYDAYVVKPGDQLRIVGQRYKLSWEYIAKVNHVDARKIRMGQKLKVVPGPFAAVVFPDRYELVIHLNGSYVKSYRVGVGKDGTTPIGTFTVKNKMVDPTYYGPEGIIPHNDPKNPLGERWIDIGDGYGIHGTIEPETIGKNESRGCIRMLNSEVEEVYDFLVIGSEVKIQK